MRIGLRFLRIDHGRGRARVRSLIIHEFHMEVNRFPKGEGCCSNRDAGLWIGMGVGIPQD